MSGRHQNNQAQIKVTPAVGVYLARHSSRRPGITLNWRDIGMNIEQTILDAGGELLRKGSVSDDGEGNKLVQWNDPETKTTLALPLDQFDINACRLRMIESRLKFVKAEGLKKEAQEAESRAKLVAWAIGAAVVFLMLVFMVKTDEYINDNAESIISNRLSSNAVNGNYGDGF